MSGPLFHLADGSPVLRAIFIDNLSMAIKYCGPDPSCYNGHSFCIGAADAGMSYSQIRALGCWKSDAFHKYIRILSLSTYLVMLRLSSILRGRFLLSAPVVLWTDY